MYPVSKRFGMAVGQPGKQHACQLAWRALNAKISGGYWACGNGSERVGVRSGAQLAVGSRLCSRKTAIRWRCVCLGWYRTALSHVDPLIHPISECFMIDLGSCRTPSEHPLYFSISISPTENIMLGKDKSNNREVFSCRSDNVNNAKLVNMTL